MEDQIMTKRQIVILAIIGVLILIITIYFLFGNPEKIKQRIQNQCYEKVFNQSDFWILKEMRNENKTFIYCNNEWGTCVCKFYWGTGVIIYKDRIGLWDMPNFKEVQKEDGERKEIP